MVDKVSKFKLVTGKLKKMFAGGMLVFATSGQSATAHTDTNVGNGKVKTTALAKTKSAQENKTDYSPIKITKYADIEKLFDMSLSIIFAELILEEVPMQNVYDDGGRFKGKKNTFGAGTTYAPLSVKDYNKTDAKWYHVAANPKTFGNMKTNYENMLKYIIGWGRYRQYTQNPDNKKIQRNEIVLKRMFDNLKGCSLRPNEFAALYCAAYNNEKNINLCKFVKEHHADPIACANKLMNWWKTPPANPGTKYRCAFEAAVYLNVDDFCGAMLDMNTCPDVRYKSKKTGKTGYTGYSCVNTDKVKFVTLTQQNYQSWSKDVCDKYKKVCYHNGKRTGDICGPLKKYFKNPLYARTTSSVSLQKQYDSAIKLYKDKKYNDALKILLDIQSKGATGGDLLNDIAICYMNLEQYDKCIKYCQMVLKSGNTQEYAKACYNAGRAYEYRQDYASAARNYAKAQEYYDKYGVANADASVDYEKIYENALARVQQLQIVKENNTRQR